MWQSESLRLDEGTLGLFLWNYVSRMNINKCWQLCICGHACVFWLVGGSVWARPLCVFAPGTWGWPQFGGHQWKHGAAPGRPHPLPTCGTAAPGALSQHQCTEQGETSALDSSINHTQKVYIHINVKSVIYAAPDWRNTNLLLSVHCIVYTINAYSQHWLGEKCSNNL